MNGRLTETVKDRRHGGRTYASIAPRPSTIQDALRPHHLRRKWGLSVLRTVESVGPDETVQQGARLGHHLLVDDGDEGDLEDGVGEIGVHGEAGEARPNARVGHRVLAGVIPPIGDVQRLNGTDTTVVGDLVEGPGLASARSTDPVDGAELDSLEGGLRCSRWRRSFSLSSWSG